MILLGFGVEMLVRLMRSEVGEPDSAWLLSGPTDPAVVEAEPDALPLAAE